MQKILVLSSWLSGSSVVVDYLERVGGHICRPLTENDGNRSFNPFESEDFRAMMVATIDETNLEYRVDRKIFRDAFASWIQSEEKKAEKDGSEFVVLHHPLAIFLIDEIMSVEDVVPLVVTRPFHAIEKSRVAENWNSFYGEPAAIEIYNQIYEVLHAYTISYFTIAYRDFINNRKSRWLMLDYCGIDVTSDKEAHAFNKITRLP
jgi:hypothetical protein